MLTLHDYLPSQNAWKVRLLLNHLQLPYERKLVSIFEGQGKEPGFRAMNPTGAVPVLELEDGTAIGESNAILAYLAEGTPYLPGDRVATARVLQWLFFEADYVQSSIATLRHWRLTGKDAARTKEVLDARRDASLRVLSILDAVLDEREFLIGGTYSIADMSVFAYVHLADEAGLALSRFKNVGRWVNQVRDQPGFLAEMFPYSIDEHSHREL